MALPTPTYVFSDKFFNLDQPDAPFATIQFRVGASANINTSSDWEDINVSPGQNNMFESLTLEDNGGIINFSLNLVDRDFHNLERLVATSLVNARLKNIIHDDTVVSSPDQMSTFGVVIGTETFANLRIRIGYADQPDNSLFIDESEQGSPNFLDRVGAKADKTVLRSPWMYFMISNVSFNVRGEGLGAQITGFSLADSLLNRIQIVRKYAVIRGKPKDIILALIKLVIDKGLMTSDTLKCNLDPSYPPPPAGTGPQPPPAGADDPLKVPYVTDAPILDGEIEIVMGGEEDDANTTSSRSLGSLFNEICAKIPPKGFDKNFQAVASQRGTDAPTETATTASRYTYMIESTIVNGKECINIHFYYPNPIDKYNGKVRTYIWYEYGNSIIRNLNINSKYDFAQLNLPIVVYDKTTESYKFVQNSFNNGDTMRTTLIKQADVTGALDVGKLDFDGLFVSNSAALVSGNNRAANYLGKTIAQAITANLNASIFEGTIDLPGDPFYMFDKNLRPYEYIIKIIVQKPSYIDSNQNMITNTESYLTGHYLVKSITHTVSNNGFNTNLAISRYPDT